ncbi:MAG TPA: plastocyanin/azurin family copper-binding protein, partial [Candidatus Bathyarchaeia archaeon]|nr:plastocyanin/azurin family copper-binding protein [Candidatus Bathyarchaeia archaeon]
SSLFSSSSTSVTFTAPNSGTYNYYCTIHYPAMVGTLVVQTPDFTISSSPSSLTIMAGSSANSTISIATRNGFSGTLSLQAAVTPTGPSTSFNSTSITVPSGGSASRLTISTTSSTQPGAYTVNVTATNGSLAHSTMIQVTIVPQPPASSATGYVPLTALAAAAVVIVAVVGIAVFLVRRRTVSK